MYIGKWNKPTYSHTNCTSFLNNLCIYMYIAMLLVRPNVLHISSFKFTYTCVRIHIYMYMRMPRRSTPLANNAYVCLVDTCTYACTCIVYIFFPPSTCTFLQCKYIHCICIHVIHNTHTHPHPSTHTCTYMYMYTHTNAHTNIHRSTSSQANL